MGDIRFQQHGPSDEKESQGKTRKRNTRKSKGQHPAEPGIDLVKQRLAKANPANGFISVCDIVEGDSLEGLRPRSVAVEARENEITLRIKAEGKTLQAFQYAVQELFSDKFEVQQSNQTIKLIGRQ